MAMSRAGKVELARHDADHFVRVVVHGDLAAQYIGRPAVTPLPQSVADDDDPHAFLVFFFREHPPHQRIHAQYAPKVRRRLTRRNLFGLGIARECRGCRLGDRGVGENGVVAPPLQPFGGRGKALRASAAQVVPDHDETVRVGVREGTNQYRVEGAEHRRNPADAECQCCDGDGREPWIPTDLAQSVGGVARELLQARPAPHGASVLLHQCEVAQFAACCPSGLVVREAVCLTLFRLLLQVELKFLAQFGFLVRPFGQPTQLAEEGVHCAS